MELASLEEQEQRLGTLTEGRPLKHMRWPCVMRVAFLEGTDQTSLLGLFVPTCA